MNEREAKKAYSDAEKEIREKQIENLKNVVKRTLEELEKAKEERKKISEKIKYLELDLEDLKLGKIERIEERQKNDEKSKKYSVVIVEKPIVQKEIVEKHYYYDKYEHWFSPFRFHWNTIYCQSLPDVNTIFGSNMNVTYANAIADSGVLEISNSVAKDYTIGSYSISDNTINLR